MRNQCLARGNISQDWHTCWRERRFESTYLKKKLAMQGSQWEAVLVLVQCKKGCFGHRKPSLDPLTQGLESSPSKPGFHHDAKECSIYIYIYVYTHITYPIMLASKTAKRPRIPRNPPTGKTLAVEP